MHSSIVEWTDLLRCMLSQQQSIEALESMEQPTGKALDQIIQRVEIVWIVFVLGGYRLHLNSQVPQFSLIRKQRLVSTSFNHSRFCSSKIVEYGPLYRKIEAVNFYILPRTEGSCYPETLLKCLWIAAVMEGVEFPLRYWNSM